MFNWYVGLLAVSGVAMVAMSMSTNGQNNISRIINLVFGTGFIGYAVYLFFIFDGGSYLIFFQAFIVPVVMAWNYVKNRTPRVKLTDTQKAWREYHQSEQKQ